MKLTPQNFTPPNPRVIESHSREVEPIVRTETHIADSEAYSVDRIMDQPIPRIVTDEDTIRPTLSKLVDEDFPFDESQLEAIDGLSREKHACMTGAAGTGKTTVTKAVVDRIVDQLPHIDMSTYFKRGVEETPSDDPDDDYEVPEQLIPAVACVAFTGRASQQIKRNFPRDWHGNIMTIHRLLAYIPEFYEDMDLESGEMKKKMRFIPTYNASNKLPWKVIIIDEAGMLGLELWHNLLAACHDDTRIIMIGDINQLPPTHGKSVFGFAMAKWPTWELTHIHRQVGVNNSIVDNAWRVINGQYPVSDNPAKPDWKFVMMEINPETPKASKQVRAWLNTIRGKIYDPIRDSVITPINAYDETAGWELGQDPLNRELAIMFNSDHGRFVIDAGRERKYFAEGDKVMATKNDHEAGITNGMTGVIKTINANGAYTGNRFRYGLIDEVSKYLSDNSDDDMDFSLEDLASHVSDNKEKKEKESRDRGPASHIVTVEFGHGDSSFEIVFSTLAEVASLMTAYVVTCHKMQGGEAPFIIVICHQAHKRMLYREWLYTAITRASERCVILYTKMGMSAALGKQNIKGATLMEKVEAFNKMQDKNGLMGASIDVRLPEPLTLEGFRNLAATGFEGKQIKAEEGEREDYINESREIVTDGAECSWCGTVHYGGPENCPDNEPQPQPRIIERIIHTKETVILRERPPVQPQPEPEVVDMGDAKRQEEQAKTLIQLSAPVKLIPQMGAVQTLQRIQDEQSKKLLTYQPKVAPKKFTFKLK